MLAAVATGPAVERAERGVGTKKADPRSGAIGSERLPQSPTGLADGFGAKEVRLGAVAPFTPRMWIPRSPGRGIRPISIQLWIGC